MKKLMRQKKYKEFLTKVILSCNKIQLTDFILFIYRNPLLTKRTKNKMIDLCLKRYRQISSEKRQGMLSLWQEINQLERQRFVVSTINNPVLTERMKNKMLELKK